jgi:hypothetical protein
MTQPVPGRERAALLERLGVRRRHVLGVMSGLIVEHLRSWTRLADGFAGGRARRAGSCQPRGFALSAKSYAAMGPSS